MQAQPPSPTGSDATGQGRARFKLAVNLSHGLAGEAGLVVRVNSAVTGQQRQAVELMPCQPGQTPTIKGIRPPAAGLVTGMQIVIN